MVMGDLVDQARDDEVMRICELRLADAQKALARASAQVANISQLAVTERPPPQLSSLGFSLFEKKKKIKKCVCGGIVEPDATYCGDCGKKLAAAAAAVTALETKTLTQWVMVKDSAGRPYYWNQSDDSTSWVAPPGFVPPAISPSTPTPSPTSRNTNSGESGGRYSDMTTNYKEDNCDKDAGSVQEEEDFESEATEKLHDDDDDDDEDNEFAELTLMETLKEHNTLFNKNNKTNKKTSVANTDDLANSSATENKDPYSPSFTKQAVSPLSPQGRRRHSQLGDGFAVMTEDNVSAGDTQTSSWKAAYNMVGLMGLGAFGSVHLVEHRATKKMMALKAVNLFHLNEKQKRLSEAQLASERLAFSRIIDHSFLLTCHHVFEEDNVTFLLLDACLGGDLSFMMNKGRHFTERMAQFYGACLILALKHLHSKDLVHCDVKPENILLDSAGYPRLCDYGNSKDVSTGDVLTELGTIEYCAPEIVERKRHNTAVDIWALGVLLYELVTGSCPFSASSRAVTVRRITTDPIDVPGCSQDLTHLLSGMLERDASIRADLSAIKAHRWFAGIDWDALAKRTFPAPIVPVIASNKDLSNFVVMDHKECSVCRGFSAPT